MEFCKTNDIRTMIQSLVWFSIAFDFSYSIYRTESIILTLFTLFVRQRRVFSEIANNNKRNSVAINSVVVRQTSAIRALFRVI